MSAITTIGIVLREIEDQRFADHAKLLRTDEKTAWFGLNQVFTAQRLARRALLLEGRLPWLAFFSLRCGLAMF